MMKGKSRYISILLVIFLAFASLSCAKANVNNEVDKYSFIEKEINKKIKVINKEILSAIERYKKTNDLAEFEKAYKLIKKEATRLLKYAKKAGKKIASKEVREYHKLAIKFLETQIEYLDTMINQFKNKGDLRNNDAKATQIEYNKKFQALLSKQDKILESIARN